jgi:quercetin dioxygenase-like cupin family protein
MAAGQFETLEEFKTWWLRKKPLRPPLSGVYKYPGLTTVTLYRRGQYQVQMVVTEPNVDVAEHCHPNVDSYEMALAGVGDVSIADVLRNTKKMPIFVHIPAGCVHSGKSSPEGGIFLSIQKWLNNVSPTCVGLDSSDATTAATWCVEES